MDYKKLFVAEVLVLCAKHIIDLVSLVILQKNVAHEVALKT